MPDSFCGKVMFSVDFELCCIFFLSSLRGKNKRDIECDAKFRTKLHNARFPESTQGGFVLDSCRGDKQSRSRQTTVR